ncbi:cellulose biosynthesis protein BcsC [Salinicola sp. CPA57]|uniref:cellulose biosynthesis protein BcsC n=1 Tax=Salinicola sp. CPA57 TaxID=1949080 RepID=UPI0018E58F24|nr:cellulose biosynthesis protein BcsC [Salinicola sp. CPA57]
MKRDRWYGLLLLGMLGGSTPLLAQPVGDSLQPLFDQAAFWQSRQRVDLAEESLERILSVDPQNREALFRLGLLAIDNDDTTAADEWLSRLQQVAPDDSRVERLRQAKERRNIDPVVLARARALAKAGNLQGALREYDQLFGSDGPPWDLAAEYYETLAGTDGGWSRASKALDDLHQRAPDDKALALASARVMSYRAESRRTSIDQLSQMAPSASTRAAWRQALLWLDAGMDDQGLYERYLQRYPDDQAVREYFLATAAEPETDPVAQARGEGYQALDDGKLTQAQASFDTALGADAEDAESLAGLGLVALRQQRFAQARDQLGQAIQMAPSRADQWTSAFRSASFYSELAEVRRLASSGKSKAALTRVAPLTRESGRDGRAARLLEADLLHRQGNDDAAEQRYRQVLAEDSRNVEATQGLVGVLRAQQRWQEAETLAQQLPAKVRASLGDPRRDQAQALREQANQRFSAGDNAQAHRLFSQAIELAPDDPWIRLDLARLYQAEGKPYQASFVMSQLLGDEATPEALEAGALLAGEQQRWDDADTLLQRIPAGSGTSQAMADLKGRVAFQRQLATVQRRMASRDPSARETLYQWYRNPPSSPDAVGSVALALADAGQPGMALELVRRNLAQADISKTPTAYLGHALVLAKAGHFEEAKTLLSRLDAAASSPEQRAMLTRTAGGIAVAQADQLRQQQRYADAYDVLQPALQASPDDPQLLLALGRLYSSGEMPDAAASVYDHLLETQPDNDEVLAGAVNAALEQGNDQRAETLLVKHAPLSSPSLVILAARTARAQGDREQAIRLLEQARDQQLAVNGESPLLPQTAMASGQLGMSGNPFRQTQQAARVSGSRWDAISATRSGSRSVSDDSVSTEFAGDTTLGEIDRLLTELHGETAPRLVPSATLRQRDGESGLSELTSLGSTMMFSAAPFKRGRLEVSVSPEYVSAGEASGSARERYGSNSFVTAAEALQTRLSDVSTILDSIQDSADSYQVLALQDQQNPGDPLTQLQLARAAESFQQALDRNPLFEAGIDTASLSDAQLSQFRAAVRQFVVTDDLSASERSQLLGDIDSVLDADFSNLDAEEFTSAREALEESLTRIQQGIGSRLAAVPRAARRPDSITDAGVGLELAYRLDSIDADIGSTPLGFEKSSVVGGITWRPQISEDTHLSVTAERRAVKDSVLSYAGVKDPLTGETWGAVTRTGGKVGIEYDDGKSGAYASAGAYVYRGENVADNHSFNLDTGAYVRPINEPDRQLQVGVNLGYMGFDKNLRYFTYGHGGYFSPQGYVSLAFPVSYQQRQDKWTYRISAAPGFQSYQEDDADVFPEDGDSQSSLDTLAAAGLVGQSHYDGESKSGFGVTLGGDVSYQLATDLSVGGTLGYDTFGDYSETSASVYLNYQLGARP